MWKNTNQKNSEYGRFLYSASWERQYDKKESICEVAIVAGWRKKLEKFR